ncbi:hypothetical protein [Rubrobacter xylanophilus]|uniref:hypothetical protein n=1 Tax=Rubrobacter xylanophilus TaxID=49319 RepID=UPI00059BFB20|nr:hypothetical protein [Rubrobacter xylanophilus]
MRRPAPGVLLGVLVVAVPVLVAGAGLAAFALLRAGYGLLVSGGLPLVALLAVVGALGAALGRAASRRRGDGSGGDGV